jgi:hypothetical protein
MQMEGALLMKFDQQGKHVCFRAGSAAVTLSSTSQRGYLMNRRDDSINLGKEGFLAILESISEVNVVLWHSRETDMMAVTFYCVTDAP